jgi:hypothetical protein
VPQTSSTTRRSFLQAAAALPALAAQETDKRLDSARLKTAIAGACSWITDVAQMKSDALNGESNSHNLQHRHWKGALRGEYRAATRQWDFFCPVWHTGQAIKALVLAAKALDRPALLDAARFSAGFIGAERVADKAHPHYGLVFGFEDRGDQVNTSAVLECADGLWLLSDATGDARYAEWASSAARWVAKNADLGNGLLRDAFEVKTWRYVAPPWKTDKPGRPLNDDFIFLTAWRRNKDAACRKLFFEIAERLLKDEEPAGNWINYVPCNAATGSIHPRHAYWWGRPMVAAYRESHDRRYLDCARRAGEWYLNAMRTDGGLFRGTTRDFKTPSFGHENSGIACAAILWQDLWKETREERWLAAIRKSLRFLSGIQFRETSDPNLKGAILERVGAPDGTDRSPYYLRDLGTIFFVQAAARMITEEIPL